MLKYTIHNYRGIKGSEYTFEEREDMEDQIRAYEIELKIKETAGYIHVGYIPELNITIHSYNDRSI